MDGASRNLYTSVHGSLERAKKGTGPDMKDEARAAVIRRDMHRSLALGYIESDSAGDRMRG